MSAPELKTDPKYGHYPWWPEDGDDWVHPDDVAMARRLIPGPRIFRRDGRAGDYDLLHYGELTLRVKRALWQAVEYEGLDLGMWVEVLTRGMTNQPHTGTIREMHWDPHSRGVRYQLEVAGAPVPNYYAAEDLRAIEPPTPREEIVIEPSPEE